MSSSVYKVPLKMKANRGILKLLDAELMTGNFKLKTANLAATDTADTAVAAAEPSAAFVPFQRQHASLSPTQNVNSAASPMFPARQFSGSIAISAANAAIFATFRHLALSILSNT